MSDSRKQETARDDARQYSDSIRIDDLAEDVSAPGDELVKGGMISGGGGPMTDEDIDAVGE